MTFSLPSPSLLLKLTFVSKGDWGEGKIRKRARDDQGERAGRIKVGQRNEHSALQVMCDVE